MTPSTFSPPTALQVVRAIVCGLLLCLPSLNLSAIEGVDYTTGGNWNTPSTPKAWSYDGQNRYGTAGYHFFNVTPIGGKRTAVNPLEENLKSALPSYIKAIKPTEGSHTSHSFGYLEIDPPGQSEADKVESGLLAKPSQIEGDSIELLTIELGNIKDIYGFRLGILIGNADRAELSPSEVTLSNADNSWSRSVINLPTSTKGIWVFFNIPAKHSNSSLTISIKSRSPQPAVLSGLVFDDLIVAPPDLPLNVFSTEAVTRSGSAVWNAALEDKVTESPATSWEHALAMKLLDEYQQNQSRIEEIQNELNKLPTPYTGEPTGTGGYLSHWLPSSKNKITINFRWDKPVTIDAIALLPLRLFLADENGLTNNAYWPKEIKIHAINDNNAILLQTITQGKQRVGQSLPELASFEATTTQHLRVTLSELAKKAGGTQYAGGLSEICIFSGDDNVAPEAKVSAKNSREGYRVFSMQYLTDGHTPLGLPEVGPRTSGSLGLSIRTPKHIPNQPVNIQLDFEEVTTVDAVRLDPAVIYKPGQAFPIRFAVELLGSDGQVLQRDLTYQNSPLRNLGLNPYISHFPETAVSAIRIQIYEISKPTALSRPWIQISEITPILKGKHINSPATVSTNNNPRKTGTTDIFDPTGRRLYWQNDFIYDGQTQAGRALPYKDWLAGLQQRKELLEEQLKLKAVQQDTVRKIHIQTLWGTFLLLSIVVITALTLVIRSKVKHRRALRMARERIASDLHDDVGSNLGTITLHTEFLKDQVDSPSMIEHLDAITQLTRESVYGLREVLHTSAPRIGRAQNILQYMEELSQLVLPNIELKMDLAPSANTALRSPERRKGILLYYKEAITNIRSHANCQHVSVTMQKNGRILDLVIEDDGAGMTAEKLSQASTLRTLKLRAQQLDGELNIISKVDKGTRLELKIPLKR
ncbi:MAG: sensor histidine kinase [Opitutaceae bacterium]